MSRAALKFLFDFVDMDKDGLLSNSELTTALQLLGYHPTENDVQELLLYYYPDAQDKMNLDDFETLVCQQLPPPSQDEEILSSFRLFDPDFSGHIAVADFRKIMSEASCLSALQVEEMVQLGATAQDMVDYTKIVDFVFAKPETTDVLQCITTALENVAAIESR